MIIAGPFLVLMPDITLMLISRVFYRSPADVHMLRFKHKGKFNYEVKEKAKPGPLSPSNVEEIPLNNSILDLSATMVADKKGMK